MPTNQELKSGKKSTILRCPKCGNTKRFLEVVEMESHIVDGNLNYKELVDSWPDHYTCCQCLHIIEAKQITTAK